MNVGTYSYPNYAITDSLSRSDPAQKYIDYVYANSGTIQNESVVRSQIGRAVGEGWWDDVACWYGGAGGYRTSGDVVTTWFNYKANGTDAYQTVSGICPSFATGVTGIHNLPAMKFDAIGTAQGKSLYMGNASWMFPFVATLFIVSETTSNDSLFALFGTQALDQWWGGAGLGNVSYPGTWRGSRVDGAWGSSPNAGAHVWDVTASAQQYVWNCDGSRLYSGGAYSYSPGNFYRISDNWNTNERSWAGHIAEVILFGSTLDGQSASGAIVTYTDKRGSVYSYLTGRYK